MAFGKVIVKDLEDLKDRMNNLEATLSDLKKSNTEIITIANYSRWILGLGLGFIPVFFTVYDHITSNSNQSIQNTEQNIEYLQLQKEVLQLQEQLAR